MATSLEHLKAALQRQEAKHGPDDPVVKMLRDQVRQWEETGDKTLHEMYISGRRRSPRSRGKE